MYPGGVDFVLLRGLLNGLSAVLRRYIVTRKLSVGVAFLLDNTFYSESVFP
jgi:hypothetical protein